MTLSPLMRERLKQAFPYLCLMVAVLAAYSNVYGNEFLFDDEKLITKNIYLRHWSSIGSIFMASSNGGSGSTSDFYRPMQTLLYLVVYQLAGLSVAAFHILNVGLHVANTLLVYKLGKKLGFKNIAVFLTALIWGVHPIHTEAVTYMSATADTAYVFFILLGILALLPDFSALRIALSCLLFIFALMSKEGSVMFPALASTVLFYVSEHRKNWKIYLRLWPMWVISAIYIVLHLTILNFQANDMSFAGNPIATRYSEHISVRIMTALATMPFYFELMTVPVGLHLERQFPIFVAIDATVLTGAAMALAAMMQIIWGKAKRGLALSWGFLWFGVACSPQTGIAMPVNALFLEHWMYLPSVGLFLGLAQSIAVGLSAVAHKPEARGTPQVICGVALAIAVIFGVMTFEQNRIWHDPYVYYPSILSREPSPRAFTNFGKVYMEAEQYDQALALFHQSIKVADALPETHQNIAYVLVRQPGWRQHPEEAIAELKRALELDPHFLPACDGLAYVYAEIGEPKQAETYKKCSGDLRHMLTP